MDDRTRAALRAKWELLRDEAADSLTILMAGPTELAPYAPDALKVVIEDMKIAAARMSKVISQADVAIRAATD